MNRSLTRMYGYRSFRPQVISPRLLSLLFQNEEYYIGSVFVLVYGLKNEEYNFRRALVWLSAYRKRNITFEVR